jgi:hypothetical protein
MNKELWNKALENADLAQKTLVYLRDTSAAGSLAIEQEANLIAYAAASAAVANVYLALAKEEQE